MDKLKRAQLIALIATALCIIGSAMSWGGPANTNEVVYMVGSCVTVIGIIVGIVSYFFGGFKTAMAIVWKIAKWSLVVLPFPISIAGFPFTIMLAGVILLFVPIIPVRKAYKAALESDVQ